MADTALTAQLAIVDSRRGFRWYEWIFPALALLFVATVVAPGAIAPHEPLAVDPGAAFTAPSLAHPFGTDDSGRDVLSRLVHGARTSLGIGVTATVLGLLLGSVIGYFAAGSTRPLLAPVRYTSDRLTEALFAFPGLLLGLLVVAIRGPGALSIVIAVALSTAPGYARMLRGEMRRTLHAENVEAALIQGDSRLRVWFRIILPEAFRPVLVLATLGVGHAVILAAALSFLGLGAPPPAPEWGAMLNAGRPYLTRAWWLTVFPGLTIVLVGLTATVLGRLLSRRWEANSDG